MTACSTGSRSVVELPIGELRDHDREWTVKRIEKGERPTYVLTYSRPLRLARLALIMVLVAAAVVNWVLAWIRFWEPVILALRTMDPAAGWGRVLLEALAAQPLRPFLSAHLSLLLTAGAVALVYALLPDLSVAEDGLVVRTWHGWDVVPWSTIQAVRFVSIEKRDLRLVLVQGSWTRWSPWPRLVSAMLGGGWAPGLVFASTIRDFRPLVMHLYQEVRGASPHALFDHQFLSPPAALVTDPVPTLGGLADQAREEGWPFDLSLQAMAAVPASLIVVQLLLLLLRGGAWWKPLAIVGLCGLEWGAGALYLYALAELLPGSTSFREGLLLYPMPQIPRALFAVPMAMLVSASLFFPAALLGLAGVLSAVTLTALLVQQMYRLPSLLPALMGGALQAFLQFLILAIVFGG